jgi:hypothetical protein
VSSSISISNGENHAARSIFTLARFVLIAFVAGAAVWAAYAFCAIRFLNHSVILRANNNVIEAKLDRLKQADRGPNLIIVSGSNGFYSIDSDALSAATGMPVTNAALQWSYAIYMLNRIVALSKPGDVVLLPLEYQYFTVLSKYPPLESCHYLMQDREPLKTISDYAFALVNCSPAVALEGLRYQLLAGLGLQFPPYSAAEIMTQAGDILENTKAAATYRVPTTSTLMLSPDQPFGHPRFAEDIRALVNKGVRVFLTYPVSPATVPPDLPIVEDGWTQAYKRWGESLGAKVISAPNEHVFPTDCFYDSNYHLHRGCTAENSAKYAEALKPYLAK